MRNLCLIAFAFLLLAGCNTYTVRALPHDPNLKEVVLIDNRKVRVRNFKANLVREFNRRGIRVVERADATSVKPEDYFIQYDARRSWSIIPFLSDADVSIHHNGEVVGCGHYHHVGRSMSVDYLTKRRSVEWKMRKLYRELLRNYDRR